MKSTILFAIGMFLATPCVALCQGNVWSRLADDDMPDWKQTWIIVAMLEKEEVQQQLELVDEQVEGCRELGRSGKEVFNSLLQIARKGDDDDALERAGIRFSNEYGAKIEKHLLPHQIKKLMRIELQVRLGENPPGYGVLAPLVMEKLNLSDEQKAKLAEVDKEHKELIEEEIREFEKRLKKLKGKHRTALVSELTDEQKEILEDLVGTKMLFGGSK